MSCNTIARTNHRDGRPFALARVLDLERDPGEATNSATCEERCSGHGPVALFTRNVILADPLRCGRPAAPGRWPPGVPGRASDRSCRCVEREQRPVIGDLVAARVASRSTPSAAPTRTETLAAVGHPGCEPCEVGGPVHLGLRRSRPTLDARDRQRLRGLDRWLRQHPPTRVARDAPRNRHPPPVISRRDAGRRTSLCPGTLPARSEQRGDRRAAADSTAGEHHEGHRAPPSAQGRTCQPAAPSTWQDSGYGRASSPRVAGRARPAARHAGSTGGSSSTCTDDAPSRRRSRRGGAAGPPDEVETGG